MIHKVTQINLHAQIYIAFTYNVKLSVKIIKTYCNKIK